MSKRSLQETMCCGIDVSAKSLTVAIQRVHEPVEQRSFPNTPVGHRALIVWLRKAKSPIRELRRCHQGQHTASSLWASHTFHGSVWKYIVVPLRSAPYRGKRKF
jgi:hypothetical protein